MPGTSEIVHQPPVALRREIAHETHTSPAASEATPTSTTRMLAVRPGIPATTMPNTATSVPQTTRGTHVRLRDPASEV